MQVRVKLFATLGQHAPVPGARAGTPFEADLPAGATLADLVRQLNLPQDQVRVIFVNARAQPLAYVLNPHDDIGIFPPIGGG